MVRLEGVQGNSITGVDIEFQFLYGAIGREMGKNTTHIKVCFNSYMVRLEGQFVSELQVLVQVSIPIWCDWKSGRPMGKVVPIEFQFLYGAIGSCLLGESRR